MSINGSSTSNIKSQPALFSGIENNAFYNRLSAKVQRPDDTGKSSLGVHYLASQLKDLGTEAAGSFVREAKGMAQLAGDTILGAVPYYLRSQQERKAWSQGNYSIDFGRTVQMAEGVRGMATALSTTQGRQALLMGVSAQVAPYLSRDKWGQGAGIILGSLALGAALGGIGAVVGGRSAGASRKLTQDVFKPIYDEGISHSTRVSKTLRTTNWADPSNPMLNLKMGLTGIKNTVDRVIAFGDDVPQKIASELQHARTEASTVRSWLDAKYGGEDNLIHAEYVTKHGLSLGDEFIERGQRAFTSHYNALYELKKHLRPELTETSFKALIGQPSLSHGGTVGKVIKRPDWNSAATTQLQEGLTGIKTTVDRLEEFKGYPEEIAHMLGGAKAQADRTLALLNLPARASAQNLSELQYAEKYNLPLPKYLQAEARQAAAEYDDAVSLLRNQLHSGTKPINQALLASSTRTRPIRYRPVKLEADVDFFLERFGENDIFKITELAKTDLPDLDDLEHIAGPEKLRHLHISIGHDFQNVRNAFIAGGYQIKNDLPLLEARNGLGQAVALAESNQVANVMPLFKKNQQALRRQVDILKQSMDARLHKHVGTVQHQLINTAKEYVNRLKELNQKHYMGTNEEYLIEEASKAVDCAITKFAAGDRTYKADLIQAKSLADSVVESIQNLE